MSTIRLPVATLTVNGRELNVYVRKVIVHGAKGENETEVLMIQERDGGVLTVFPRTVNVIWVQ